MMRRSEWTLLDECLAARQSPCDRKYLCHFKTLLECQLRENSRERFGEEGLATSRRTDHEHIVPARGRDLERTLGMFLAANEREIRCVSSLPIGRFCLLCWSDERPTLEMCHKRIQG